MVRSSEQIHVGETVRLLQAFLPRELEQVREQHPDADAAAVLTPGGDVLGGDGLAPALAATAALLANLDDVCLDAVLAVRRRLATANAMDLVGKLVAASSFGTLITVILRTTDLSSQKTTALALAVVGLLGTAIPLVASWMRGGIGGDAGALVDQFAALRDLAFDTRELRSRLPMASAASDQKALVDAANDVARRAWKLLLDLGYDPRRAAPVAA